LDDFFTVARITGNFGFDGYLILKPFTDFEDTLLSLQEVYIFVFGDYRKFFVEEIKEKNGQFLIKFKNFVSYEDVLFLFKKDILIPSEKAHKLSSDEYYVHDLIGLKVLQNNLFFGKVIDVLQLPANDVLVVKKENGKEVMLPFVNDYVLDVDLKNKIISISDKEDFSFDE